MMTSSNSVTSSSSWSRVRKLMRKSSKDAEFQITRQSKIDEDDETEGGLQKDIKRTSSTEEKKAETCKQTLHRSHSDSECRFSLRRKCSKSGPDILNSIVFSGTIDEDNQKDFIQSEGNSYSQMNERRIKISATMLDQSSVDIENDEKNHNIPKIVVETKDDSYNLHQKFQNYKSKNRTDSLNYDFIKTEGDQYGYSTENTNINRRSEYQDKRTSQENGGSNHSGDSVYDTDDPFKLSNIRNIKENSFDDFSALFNATTLTSKTSPAKVYPDLLNHVSFDDFEKRKQEGDQHKINDSNREEKIDAMEKEDEDENSVMPMTKSLPHRMHNLENVVYMSPKRQNSGIPTTASVVNLDDLALLQGMYEKTKERKGKGSSGKSLGKSVLDRISKKFISSTDNIKSINSTDDSAHSKVTYEVGPTLSCDKLAEKKTERKQSASQDSMERRNRPSRMSRRIRRTFNGGSDKLLQQAVSNNDLEMLQKLLTQDRYLEEINHLEPPGVTIFHQACVYGDFHVVKLLLKKGADTALLTWSKLSPLKIAVMFGHYEIAELLLNSGADLNDIQNGF